MLPPRCAWITGQKLDRVSSTFVIVTGIVHLRKWRFVISVVQQRTPPHPLATLPSNLAHIQRIDFECDAWSLLKSAFYCGTYVAAANNTRAGETLVADPCHDWLQRKRWSGTCHTTTRCWLTHRNMHSKLFWRVSKPYRESPGIRNSVCHA